MLALEDVDDEDFIDNCEYLEDISDCDLEAVSYTHLTLPMNREV